VGSAGGPLSLRERFPRLPALFVVVHCFDEGQTVANVGIANRCGADGVFLIAHGYVMLRRLIAPFLKVGPVGSNNMRVSQLELLVSCFRRARAEFPGFFIGVNVLTLTKDPMRLWPWVLEKLEGCDGVWNDTCFAAFDKILRRIDGVRRAFRGLYFGGVAFKHQVSCGLRAASLVRNLRRSSCIPCRTLTRFQLMAARLWQQQRPPRGPLWTAW
jgi:hypothetical protein